MKYIVDTNIVSELTKKAPNPSVITWLENNKDDAYLTVITIEEMKFGGLMLPDGKRKQALLKTIDDLIQVYEPRTLSLDAQAAEQCAQLHVKAVLAGRTPTIEDLMVGALCLTHKATLVTRNVKDFDYLDIPLLNPFEPQF